MFPGTADDRDWYDIGPLIADVPAVFACNKLAAWVLIKLRIGVAAAIFALPDVAALPGLP